jgi:hypothetical protein
MGEDHMNAHLRPDGTIGYEDPLWIREQSVLNEMDALRADNARLQEVADAAEAVRAAPFLATWPPGADDLVFVRLYAALGRLSSSAESGERRSG